MAGEVTRKQQKLQIAAEDPRLSFRQRTQVMDERKQKWSEILARFITTIRRKHGQPDGDVKMQESQLESEKASLNGKKSQGIECDPAISICSTKTKSRIESQLPLLIPSHPIIKPHEFITIVPIPFLPPSSHQCEHAHVNSSSSTGKTSSEIL